MYLDFKDIKTLQDMMIIMTEMQAELREIKALLLTQADRLHLSISEISQEMGYSDFTIKSWINKGRKHPETRQVIKLKAYLTDGKHYRVARSDLEAFKKIFTTGK